MHIVIPNDWNDAFAASPEMDQLRQRATVAIHKLPGVEQDRALEQAEIVAGVRERTRFDAARLARMPKLKLIAQIGERDTPPNPCGVEEADEFLKLPEQLREKTTAPSSEEGR